jgi:DNA-binding MarR family transcriptional regulator
MSPDAKMARDQAKSAMSQLRQHKRGSSGGAGAAVDYEALARFRYELRKFQAFSQSAAKRAGLTAQQHQALLAVRGFSGKRPISVGELADCLLIRHHTAVELVNRMTRLKILSRSVDGADSRRVLVSLTREGERRLRQLSRIHLEELRAIGPTLTRLLRPFRRPKTGGRIHRS